jgi:regulatory protein YycI of two-component signal transduction system YycFG
LDWKKAITILIASFVVLNIFMVLNLWFRERPVVEFALTSTQQSEIEEVLKQRGVILQENIPKEGEAQALLEMSFRHIDEKKIVEGFFGKDAETEITQTENGRSYVYGHYQLIITDNGFITFLNNGDQILWPNLTREQAEKEAVNFMKSHGDIPEQAVLDKVTYDEQSNGYLLEFIRYYDDYYLYNSYITMLVTPSGVKTYYQCWLEPLGYVGKKRGVISPLTAILRVITEIETEHYPIVITGLEQGYNSKLYNADRWQAAPVWKIEINDSDTFFVNAYTGEMEW